MSRPLLALLACLCSAPAAAQSAAGASECAPFVRNGCYYSPTGAVNAGSSGLLIYFRGHTKAYGGSVPPAERVVSAQQAFATYGLKEAAKSLGMTIIVTGSSDVPVSGADIDALEYGLGTTFRRIILAAHSGGWEGLSASIPYNRSVIRLVMLDDFYFGPSLSKRLADIVSGGAACSGYHTAHTRDNYQRDFKPYLTCSIESRPDADHNAGVNDCLVAYARGQSCP